MQEKQVLERAFAMPLTSPAYPPGPYRFVNRQYLIITYRTDPAKLRGGARAARTRRARSAGEVRIHPYAGFERLRRLHREWAGDPVSFRGRKGSYTHCMFLNDEGRIAGGRELWGFPKKLAQPTLRTEIDTLVGTLDYGPLRVATGTMGYKHREADLAQVKASLAAPNFLLKIIPHVDGTPRICELVEYHLEDGTVKGRVDRARSPPPVTTRVGTRRRLVGSRDCVGDPCPGRLDTRPREGRSRLFATTKPPGAGCRSDDPASLV
jgi:acetoacetate decarboxylase